jgi:predicted DNA-binding protein
MQTTTTYSPDSSLMPTRVEAGQTQVGGVYSMLYMAAIRTQIYLTEAQRARLNDRAERQGVPMAHIIRDAIDSFLSTEDDLEATFGAAPNLAQRVPTRDEWERRG